MSYKVEAIVLKSREIKEVDRIYTLFSREKGKLKIVGKGVRKPAAKLASGVEPVTLSEIFLIEAKWLDKLTGVIIVNQYPKIKQDPDHIRSIKCLFEIIDLLANEKEPHEEIYEGIMFYLDSAEQGKDPDTLLPLVRLGIIWKMIQASGFQPGIFHCASCGRQLEEQDQYWFHVSLGLECQTCSIRNTGKKLRIEKDTVKLLRIFMTQRAEFLSKIIVSPRFLAQVTLITKRMLEEIVGKRVYL